MEYRNENGGLNKIVITILGGVVFLGITLIMGSYGYIHSEMKVERDEKHEWRKEHQQVLDKKFEELKEGQQKIEDVVNRNEVDNREILREILTEQKKMNDSRSSNRSKSSDR
jgi:Spy/CpxP family protein refolding chaperone